MAIRDSNRHRALVLLDHAKNRELLCDLLRRQGLEVSQETGAIDASFDICFFDAPALTRLHAYIRQMKQAAGPVHIPCLLVGHKEHNAKLLSQYAGSIDQVLSTPLYSEELRLQVSLALRTRRYSVALGNTSEQSGLAELRTHAEILANMAEGVILADDGGAIFFTNTAAQNMYGYSAQELTGMHVSQLRAGDAEEARRMTAEIIDALKEQGCWNGEFEARRMNGDTFITAARISRIVIDGKPCLVSMRQDVTMLKKTEEKLRLWYRAIEASSNGIMIIDATASEHPIIYANTAFRQITGYAPDEVKGRNPRFLYGGNSSQAGLAEIRAAIRERREGRAILRNYRKDGQPFWNELSIAPVREADGHVTHFIGVLNDITERKHYEDELKYQATHDVLTGLPNRTLLQDRLQQAIARAHRSQNMAAVLFIDLDRFKVVNDSIGYDAGDQLLRSVAKRLHSIFRAGDTVARQGGDEFVVVVERIDSEQEAAELIQRVLQSMTAPFALGQQQFYATCSIGVALYPKDGMQAFELLKNADAAMYRAKEEGRNTFRFYAAEMNARALLHFELEAAMRGAIGREEFVLHYQPQVELSTGRLIGFEALIRWQHPQLGLLPPGAFISLAEETSMIVPIGDWVLRQACRQAKAWQEEGLGQYFVAVNLSARQFSDCNLVQQVDAVLKDVGLEAQYLELELTESLLMENPESAAELLRRLRERGVRLSIDDFGTGYSSLGYLKRFPLDKLKIDYSFVRDIINDPDDAAIATAIIAMAHRLKLKVVAEGVETQDQLAYLGLHRCDEVQGFLFSHPLPADDCTAFLRSKPAFDPPQGTDRRRTVQAVR